MSCCGSRPKHDSGPRRAGAVSGSGGAIRDLGQGVAAATVGDCFSSTVEPLLPNSDEDAVTNMESLVPQVGMEPEPEPEYLLEFVQECRDFVEALPKQLYSVPCLFHDGTSLCCKDFNQLNQEERDNVISILVAKEHIDEAVPWGKSFQVEDSIVYVFMADYVDNVSHQHMIAQVLTKPIDMSFKPVGIYTPVIKHLLDSYLSSDSEPFSDISFFDFVKVVKEHSVHFLLGSQSEELSTFLTHFKKDSPGFRDGCFIKLQIRNHAGFNSLPEFESFPKYRIPFYIKRIEGSKILDCASDLVLNTVILLTHYEHYRVQLSVADQRDFLRYFFNNDFRLIFAGKSMDKGRPLIEYGFGYDENLSGTMLILGSRDLR